MGVYKEGEIPNAVMTRSYAEVIFKLQPSQRDWREPSDWYRLTIRGKSKQVLHNKLSVHYALDEHGGIVGIIDSIEKDFILGELEYVTIGGMRANINNGKLVVNSPFSDFNL